MFSKSITWELGNQKLAYIPTLHNHLMLLHYTWPTPKEHRSGNFSLKIVRVLLLYETLTSY